MSQLPTILAIALGGAIGAVARWAISNGVHRCTGIMGIPVGTFIVNMVGCVAIGFCYIYFQNRGSDLHRSFLSIGFIGALTTFSTYSIESIELLQRGCYGYAAANLIASVVLGLGCAVLGMALGRLVTGS
jgi:CrcB protein